MKKKPDSCFTTPGFDFPVFWRVLKKEFSSIFIPFCISILFFAVFLVTVYFSYDKLKNGDISIIILNGIAFLFGGGWLFIVCHAVITQTRYHYAQEIIKKHGVNITGNVLSVEPFEEYEEDGELIVTFSYRLHNQDYTGSDFLPDNELFRQLDIGSPLPLRTLLHKPDDVTIRKREFQNQLKRNIKANSIDNSDL